MGRDIHISVGDISRLPEAAHEILEAFPGEKIFALYGDLGAGKTTLIKEFCRQLGVGDIVTSPSFAIVNEYLTMKGNRIYHFDFYRVKKQEEVLDIGFEEYISGRWYCFLEWADKIPDLLPDRHVNVRIGQEEEGMARRIMAGLAEKNKIIHQ